ncbi:MAG: hypothetical protein IPK50_07720 [Fibrobacterota bacterium]|nr:MAG: hypothetical protein IPK50_07720 [Fibrobacterota bacterium]
MINAIILLSLSFHSAPLKNEPRPKLDQSLQLYFSISSTEEKARRIIKSLHTPEKNQKPLWYPFEPFLAFCKLEMHDSIQSFGARYIQQNSDSGRCTYFAAVPVAISQYATGKNSKSRSTIETAFNLCSSDPKAEQFSYSQQVRISNLMARILEKQGKSDTARMLVAPWLSDELSDVAYDLFSSFPRKKLCRELNAALAKGPQLRPPRPQSSSPLIQFLLNSNGSPYEYSIYFEPYNLNIPIYTHPDPPSRQDLKNSISKFKNSFFYRHNDCDLEPYPPPFPGMFQ